MREARVHRGGPMLVVLFCALAGTACRDSAPYRIDELSRAQTRTLYDGLTVVSVPEATPHHLVQLQLPADAEPFAFAMAAAIDVVGMPVCRVYVTDSQDDAVHRFDLAGTYHGTIQGGARDTNRIRTPTAVGGNLRGELAVFSFAKQQYTVYDSTGVVLRTLKPAAPSGRLIDAQIRLHSNGTIIENWFQGQRVFDALAQVDWAATLPLLRMIESDGTVRTWGTIRDFGPRTLSGLLSQYRLGLRGDTVWLARSVDARITALLVEATGTVAEMPGPTSLPVFFAAGRPVEIFDREPASIARAAELHTRDIAVLNDGFAVVQALPYELAANVVDRNYEPSLVLMHYDRNGVARSLLDVGTRVHRIAGAENVIALTYSVPEDEAVRAGLIHLGTSGGGCAG